MWSKKKEENKFGTPSVFDRNTHTGGKRGSGDIVCKKLVNIEISQVEVKQSLRVTVHKKTSASFQSFSLEFFNECLVASSLLSKAGKAHRWTPLLSLSWTLVCLVSLFRLLMCGSPGIHHYLPETKSMLMQWIGDSFISQSCGRLSLCVCHVMDGWPVHSVVSWDRLLWL